jgi:hypothetical protein
LAGSFVGVNNEMFARRFGNLIVDFQAGGAIGDGVARKRGKTPFLGDAGQGIRRSINRYFESAVVLVLAKLFAEERGKIKFLKRLANL